MAIVETVRRKRNTHRVVCRKCLQQVANTRKHSIRNHERLCLDLHAFQEDVFDASASDDGTVVLLQGDLDDGGPPALGVVPTRPSANGLRNFDHLTQFLELGRCVCSDEELQLVKFVHMSHGGYGVSRNFSEGMLAYAKASGGRNFHLPDTWKSCVDRTHHLIQLLEGNRKTFQMDVPIP